MCRFNYFFLWPSDMVSPISKYVLALVNRQHLIIFGNDVYKARSVPLAKFIGRKWLRGRQSSLLYMFLSLFCLQICLHFGLRAETEKCLRRSKLRLSTNMHKTQWVVTSVGSKIFQSRILNQRIINRLIRFVCSNFSYSHPLQINSVKLENS